MIFPCLSGEHLDIHKHLPAHLLPLPSEFLHTSLYRPGLPNGIIQSIVRHTLVFHGNAALRIGQFKEGAAIPIRVVTHRPSIPRSQRLPEPRV